MQTIKPSNEEAGIPQGDGSHGICDAHAAAVMEEYRARRAEREEQADEQEEAVIAA